MNRNDYILEMSAIANYLLDPSSSLDMKDEIVKKIDSAITLMEDVKPGFQYKNLIEAFDLKINEVKSLTNISEIRSIALTIGRQIQDYHRMLEF